VQRNETSIQLQRINPADGSLVPAGEAYLLDIARAMVFSDLDGNTQVSAITRVSAVSGLSAS